MLSFRGVKLSTKGSRRVLAPKKMSSTYKMRRLNRKSIKKFIRSNV